MRGQNFELKNNNIPEKNQSQNNLGSLLKDQGVEKVPKIEKPQVKKGVDFVFKQNPELANIGTME